MANPFSNEKDLYEKIRRENITVPPLVWDAMYHYLGDYVSAISFIALISIEKNEPIGIEDGKRILDYTRKIIETVRRILHTQDIETGEEPAPGLHPLIHEFFTHHIANDIHCINFRVSFFLDPLDEQAIPVEEAAKLLDYTVSIRKFLDKLREATNKEQGH
ncbi:MAG: hypothetical protein AB1650_09805 [Candidatus Omnitrophota bacterium]